MPHQRSNPQYDSTGKMIERNFGIPLQLGEGEVRQCGRLRALLSLAFLPK
jgi:hypothetical protein